MACLTDPNLTDNTLGFATAVEDSLTTTVSTPTTISILSGSVVDGLELGTPPVAPDISEFTVDPQFPLAPDDVSISTVPVPSLPPEPTFNQDAPVFETLTPPALFSDSLPNTPALSIVDDVADPTVSLPDAPNLATMVVPEVPDLIFPELDAVMSLAPIEPVASLDWSEAAYTSELLTVYEAKLVEFLSGIATAASQKLELSMWEKRRDGLLKDSQKTIAVISDSVSARGFSGATGDVVNGVYEAFEASVFEASSASREVMISQAKLEQENFVTTIEFAIQEQTSLIDLHSQARDRALEALIEVANAKIEIFNATVRLYQVDAQVFAAQASAFKERIAAEIAKVEAVKIRLDGLNARNQLNESLVKLYVAQLKGVTATVEVFKSRVEAGRNRILNNINLVEQYRANVDGVTATIKGKKAQVDGYAENIRAETARLQAFAAQVDAYKSHTDVYKTLVDAKVDVQLVEFNQKQKVPLEAFRTKIDAFKAQVGAERVRIEALTDRQSAQLDLFATTEKVKVETASSTVKFGAAETKATIASAKGALGQQDAQQREQMAGESVSAATKRATQQIIAMQEIGVISSQSRNTTQNNTTSTSASSRESFNESFTTSCTKVGTKNRVSTASFVNITEGSGPGFFLGGPSSSTGSCS